MTEKIWQSPTKPWDLCSPRRQEMLRVAWSAGNLRWKLDPSQQRIYDDIYASHGKVNSSAERIFAMDVSRQSGKDFIMATIAVEQCFKRRFRTRIPYAAPTKDNVHELLVPTFEALFQDCPPDLLPYEMKRGTFRTNSPELNWDWGARILLVGVDLHPDWLRGPATYAIMITEPGFIDNLDGVMEGVLLPQLLTMPEGFVIMGSTPPETPGHPWSTKYLKRAKERGMYAKRTIEDCPRFSKEQVEGFIREYGGREATRVRREFYVEHIVESTIAVVPEMQDVSEMIVTEAGFSNPPLFRDTYTSLDPGFSHATGALFAWYDFKNDVVMVEGDFDVKGLNSREVARYVKARWHQLWGIVPTKPDWMTPAAWTTEVMLHEKLFYPGLQPPTKVVRAYVSNNLKQAPFRTVSDTDKRLIADMASEWGIQINPTEKDNADSALSDFRVRIQQLKYKIHPRCINFITHLTQATWNKGRTKIAESADGGHFDTIPAGVYLNRNVLWGRNPNPPVTYDPRTHYVHHTAAPKSPTARNLANLWKPRR